MEKILSVVKKVESDFKSENDKFNSYLELGSSYFAGGEPHKALDLFEKAIAEDPKNAGGWIGKAITHLAMTTATEINTINIENYIEKAIEYTDESTIKKYLDTIVLYYGHQFASAIKFYIDQTNQALAEKKSAQVAAVVGLATAVAGGAIANNSKSATGAFLGYSMLAGGTGVVLKKGYDSFTLDQLSKSLYGNALSQAIVSVPTMQRCYQIYQNSYEGRKQDIEVILDSWKQSVVSLFKNEKNNFLKLVNELSDTDKFLDTEKREAVQNKIDEILYFMDMIGLEGSKDFGHVNQLKNELVSFTEGFSKEKIQHIKNKRNRAQMGCAITTVIIFFAFSYIDEAKIFDDESSIPGLILIVGGILGYRYLSKKTKKINDESGMSDVHYKINQITSEFQKISIEKNAIDLKLLGT